MRQYTPTHFDDDMVIAPDHINLNVHAIKQVWNGNLDMNNLQVDSIDTGKFIGRSLELEGDYNHSIGQFSDYYSGYEDGNPLYTVSLRTSTSFLHGAWNTITSDYATINFTNLKEGVLYGYFLVEWERRYGKDNSPSALAVDDKNWLQEFGVFFDNKLISTTGPLFPRRDTAAIHFYTETNTGPHTLELKYKAESHSLAATDTTYAQNFSFYMVGASVRNLYR